MILGIHHAAISTPDIDRSIAFYCELLGFDLMFKAGWPKGVDSLDALTGLKESASQVAMLKKANAMLEIFQYESPAPRSGDPNRPVNDHGLTHICLDVTDIDGEYERLAAAGMRFNSEPVDTGPTRCVYGRDPDGNVIELQEFKDPNDPMQIAR